MPDLKRFRMYYKASALTQPREMVIKALSVERAEVVGRAYCDERPAHKFLRVELEVVLVDDWQPGVDVQKRTA